MNNKEAIAVLNMIECHNPLSQEAKDIAIKALEEADNTSFKEVVAYECGQKSEERPQGKLIIKNHMETCEKRACFL